ncbi:MAG TPA: TRAP transporter small permease subunit [Burkholderiales bacterium]|nr:TRAP transporter small permease subunit [Burkholderiales bacterium]
MKALLGLSRAIDALNERVGRLVFWLILVMVLVSSGNAVSRYALSMASNAWLELQWYLFSAVFLLCAGYTLLHNEHIRIDIINSLWSRRVQIWIDIFGTVFFLMPMSLYIMWSSWEPFMNAWTSGEVSGSAGGLIRWPARLLIPIGFFLLSLQGISELIKRVAFLRGLIPDPAEKQEAGAAQAMLPEGETAR